MEKQKKRGRKPKGGKILESVVVPDELPEVVQNVILHLKCQSKDLSKPLFSNTGGVEPYTSEVCHTAVCDGSDANGLQQKLKNLARNLHTNEINARSDCFWCTYAFETPAVHIPKYQVNGQYQVYGSFCCPECAAGYLMADSSLDASTRFERFHLLNYMYARVYGYQRNIIPAPPPHYLLTKFFGDLSITEYRNLIKTDSFILVLDKPVCCSYPEILQSNPEFVQPVLNTVKPEETTYRLCRKKRA
jgi:hypothetical protein